MKASQNDLTSLEYSLSSKIEKLDTSLTTRIEKIDLRIGGEIALVRGDINHVKWVLATLMAINIAVALKVFLH